MIYSHNIHIIKYTHVIINIIKLTTSSISPQGLCLRIAQGGRSSGGKPWRWSGGKSMVQKSGDHQLIWKEYLPFFTGFEKKPSKRWVGNGISETFNRRSLIFFRVEPPWGVGSWGDLTQLYEYFCRWSEIRDSIKN